MAVVVKSNMIKNYANWHQVKSKINNQPAMAPHFHEREIWWCSIGLNVGTEIDGKGNSYIRPVIIYKKQGNQSFYGIPATSQAKVPRLYYYHYKIKNRDSTFVLGQIRTYDSKRLIRKIETMPTEKFNKMKAQLFNYFR